MMQGKKTELPPGPILHVLADPSAVCKRGLLPPPRPRSCRPDRAPAVTADRVQEHLEWLRALTPGSPSAAEGRVKRAAPWSKRRPPPLRPSTAAAANRLRSPPHRPRSPPLPAQAVSRRVLGTSVRLDRARNQSAASPPRSPSPGSDAEPTEPDVDYRDQYGGLRESLKYRWSAGDGFRSLLRTIDKVIPEIDEGSLGERWRALAEWVAKFNNDRDARAVADRCSDLLHLRAAADQDQASSPQSEGRGRRFTGLRSAMTAVAMAQRMRISSRRREVATACVTLDQLLIHAGRSHPSLWPVVRKTRHVFLSLFFGTQEGVTIGFDGAEAEWSEEPAALVAVPALYAHDDKATVRKAVAAYSKRKSWYEIAQELLSKMGLLKDSIEQTETSTEKLMMVMDRAIKFWQCTVMRNILQAWRAVRRTRAAAARDAADRVDGMKVVLEQERQQKREMLIQVRRDTEDAVSLTYRLRMRELEKRIEALTGRVEDAERQLLSTQAELSEARKVADQLSEELASTTAEKQRQSAEIRRFRRICKDFIKGSLEGPSWVVFRQEEMKGFAESAPVTVDSAFEAGAMGGGGDGGLLVSSTEDLQVSPDGDAAVPPAVTALQPEELEVAQPTITIPTPAAPDDLVCGGGFLFSPRVKKRIGFDLEPLPVAAALAAPEDEFTSPLKSAKSQDWMPEGITRQALAELAAQRESEDFVLRWFNQCVSTCGYPDAEKYQVTSFDEGHKMLEPYALVMHYMSPGNVTQQMVAAVVAETREFEKAQLVLNAAELIDMAFPLTPRELVKPQAKAQHTLIATALFQRFCDPQLASACGMAPLMPPKGFSQRNPLWAEEEPDCAKSWRERMGKAWARSLRWRGAGAAAQSLATEALLSKVQGRADRAQTVAERAQMKLYVDDPVDSGMLDDVVDAASAESVKLVLGEHYRSVRRTYMYYAMGDQHDQELSVEEAHKLLQDSRVLGGGKLVTRSALEDSFRKVGKGKQTLGPTEYVVLLVRLCAEIKRGWMRRQDGVAARVREVLQEYIIPHASYVDLGEFRAAIYGDQCSAILERNHELLLASFRAFSSQGKGDSRSMTLKDFQELVGSLNIVDSTLSHEQVRTVFVKLQDMETDSAGGLCSAADRVLVFREYVECVAALAMYKTPAPYLPIARRVARFFELWFVPTMTDGRFWRVRNELVKLRQV